MFWNASVSAKTKKCAPLSGYRRDRPTSNIYIYHKRRLYALSVYVCECLWYVEEFFLYCCCCRLMSFVDSRALLITKKVHLNSRFSVSLVDKMHTTSPDKVIHY